MCSVCCNFFQASNSSRTLEDPSAPRPPRSLATRLESCLAAPNHQTQRLRSRPSRLETSAKQTGSRWFSWGISLKICFSENFFPPPPPFFLRWENCCELVILVTFPIFWGIGKFLVIPKIACKFATSFVDERGQETHQLVNRGRRE